MEMLTPTIDAQGSPVFTPPEGESQFILDGKTYVIVKTGSYMVVRLSSVQSTTTVAPADPSDHPFTRITQNLPNTDRVPHQSQKKAQWKRETTRRFR